MIQNKLHNFVSMKQLDFITNEYKHYPNNIKFSGKVFISSYFLDPETLLRCNHCPQDCCEILHTQTEIIIAALCG